MWSIQWFIRYRDISETAADGLLAKYMGKIAQAHRSCLWKINKMHQLTSKWELISWYAHERRRGDRIMLNTIRILIVSGMFNNSTGFGSRSRRFQRNKNVSSPSTCESQYCGEPPWPRGSVLGLRPPGLEFRILCHLIHLTILRRFSWPSLAYMCTKVA